MTLNRCSALDDEQCTKSKGGRTWLYLHDGKRYSAHHLPTKNWRAACTHSLGIPCSFCGSQISTPPGVA